MGFADLAAQVILVFIFIIIFVSLFTSYRSYIDSTSSNLDYVYGDLINKIQTDLQVVDANYTAGTTVLTLQNTGSTALDTGLIDVFVNGEKLARSSLTFDTY